MSDYNADEDAGMIIAVSKDKTIEFYHAFHSKVIEAVQAFKLQFSITV